MRELFPPLSFPPGHLRGEQSFPLKGTDSQPSPASRRKTPPFEKGRPLLGVTPPTRGNMPLAQALHLSPEEKRKHKEKCLVHSPRSCFMGVRCPVSHEITHWSHAHGSFAHWLLHCPHQATGGKSELTDTDSTKSTLNQVEWETIPINKF